MEEAAHCNAHRSLRFILPTETHNSRGIAFVSLLAAILCIGWSAIFVRWTDMPGPSSAFYRMLIPSVLLLPTLLWRSGGVATPGLRTMGIIAMGGLFFALDLAFYNTSILKTSAANATLLGNNTPIVVGLLSWLVFSKRPGGAFWVGLTLAVCGSLVIVWGDLQHHARFGWGDVLALLAAACFAVYLMTTEQVRAHTSTLVFLRMAIWSSTLFLFLFCLILRTPLHVPSTKSWLALLGLGLVSQLGGYLALTYAMGHLRATVTSVSLLSQGPLTALLAVPFLGERLSGSQIAGGLLVLLGIGLANHLERPEEDANATFGETGEAA